MSMKVGASGTVAPDLMTHLRLEQAEGSVTGLILGNGVKFPQHEVSSKALPIDQHSETENVMARQGKTKMSMGVHTDGQLSHASMTLARQGKHVHSPGGLAEEEENEQVEKESVTVSKAGDTFSWIVGAAGQSCNAACAAKGQACDKSRFTDSEALTCNSPDKKSICDTFWKDFPQTHCWDGVSSATSQNFAPFITGASNSNPNYCKRPSSSEAASHVTCDADPNTGGDGMAADDRRICPCNTPPTPSPTPPTPSPTPPTPAPTTPTPAPTTPTPAPTAPASPSATRSRR